ncbi:LOW QUALITY PROTEIN: hypothetical protein U9M48_030109 [Paspalum notatum var. saurae]|uniref:Transposase (putative) gypsy type domain-containing protein n=1 Tax=Paspalum notatum var. saurae TaxID=547442 RepID=A0AAQ3X2A6_PASNO
MPSSASSSSSCSLYIIGASSPLRVDPIRARAPDTGPDGGDGDTDDADSGGGGALSSTVAERFVSSFRTKEPLDALCRKYGVPEHYSAVVPAVSQRACSPPPPGAVCVYAHALEAGMRVPLHPFFCEALAHYGVAPSQVVPNGWRVMAGFVVLSHSAGVPPSLPVFRHFFSLCASRDKGWYWFRGKDAAGALFKGIPHSFKGWKEEFFFLRSPAPWPCPVKWGELSKGSTAEPVLTREEQSVAKKLLRAHGAAVDIKTFLSESNLAAAMINRSPKKSPPPPSARTGSSAQGMDPSVYDMMKNLRAAKATQAASGQKVTVKSEPGSSDTPSSVKKRKLAAAEEAANTPREHAHGRGACSPPPPGFSAQKSSKSVCDRGHDPKPRHTPDLPDSGDTGGWEAARRMLQSIVTPSQERAFSAATPSDVIASGYVAVLQAANYASFSLGYALELEEKLAAREREVGALRQELAQAKVELAGARKASAEEVRSAREAGVREFQGSTEEVLQFAEHALAGYERGMEDMKRAALRQYPHLDPEQLVVPADGGGPQ